MKVYKCNNVQEKAPPVQRYVAKATLGEGVYKFVDSPSAYLIVIASGGMTRLVYWSDGGVDSLHTLAGMALDEVEKTNKKVCFELKD